LQFPHEVDFPGFQTQLGGIDLQSEIRAPRGMSNRLDKDVLPLAKCAGFGLRRGGFPPPGALEPLALQSKAAVFQGGGVVPTIPRNPSECPSREIFLLGFQHFGFLAIIFLLPAHCSPVTNRTFHPLFPPQPLFYPSPISPTTSSGTPRKNQIPSNKLKPEWIQAVTQLDWGRILSELGITVGGGKMMLTGQYMQGTTNPFAVGERFDRTRRERSGQLGRRLLHQAFTDWRRRLNFDGAMP
jgi:hypothetical protein